MSTTALFPARCAAPGPNRGPSQRGYSAIELVMAMALLGILATAGVTGVQRFRAREELEGWTKGIAADVAAGRQAAMTRRATVTVAITSTTFTISALGTGTIRQDTVPAGITLSTTCAANVCSFDRRGVPVTYGTITASNSALGTSYTIDIASTTGRVSHDVP